MNAIESHLFIYLFIILKSLVYFFPKKHIFYSLKQMMSLCSTLNYLESEPHGAKQKKIPINLD